MSTPNVSDVGPVRASPGASLQTLVAQQVTRRAPIRKMPMTLMVAPPLSPALMTVRFGLMTAAAHVQGTRTAVILRGEADRSTIGALADVLSWVTAWRSDDMVADLADLTFIDAAAVDVLAECHRLLEQDGRRMTLRGPSKLAVRLLRMSTLGDHIEDAGGGAQPALRSPS